MSTTTSHCPFPGYRGTTQFPFLYITWYGETLLTAGGLHLLNNPRATVGAGLAIDAKSLSVGQADSTYLTPNRWENHVIPYPSQLGGDVPIRRLHTAVWSDILQDPRLTPLETSVAGWSPFRPRTDLAGEHHARAWSFPDPESYFTRDTSDGITYASLAFRNIHHLSLFHNLSQMGEFLEYITKHPHVGTILHADIPPPIHSIINNRAHLISYAVAPEDKACAPYSFILQIYGGLYPPVCFTAAPEAPTYLPGDEDAANMVVQSGAPLLRASMMTAHQDEEEYLIALRLHKSWIYRVAAQTAQTSPTSDSQPNRPAPPDLRAIRAAAASHRLATNGAIGRAGTPVLLDPIGLRFQSVALAANFLGVSAPSLHTHIRKAQPRLYPKCEGYRSTPITPRLIY